MKKIGLLILGIVLFLLGALSSKFYNRTKDFSYERINDHVYLNFKNYGSFGFGFGGSSFLSFFSLPTVDDDSLMIYFEPVSLNPKMIIKQFKDDNGVPSIIIVDESNSVQRNSLNHDGTVTIAELAASPASTNLFEQGEGGALVPVQGADTTDSNQ